MRSESSDAVINYFRAKRRELIALRIFPFAVIRG